MANKAYTYYTELPAWAKGVVVVGGLAVTYIFVSQIISRIKKQASDKENRQAVESAKDDLQDLNKRGVKPTLTKAQTDSMADAILNQYKNADLFLQSYTVTERQFNKLKNDADYLMLKTSWGVRTYPDAFFGSVSNVTLEAAIQNELFNSSISKLNTILTKKGINYTI
jgi:hypothetical protein